MDDKNKKRKKYNRNLKVRFNQSSDNVVKFILGNKDYLKNYYKNNDNKDNLLENLSIKIEHLIEFKKDRIKELELLKDKIKITKHLKDLKNLEMAQIELKRIKSCN